MVRLSDILEKVQAYAPGADLKVVEQAYILSAKCHAGQKRKSGEPYLIHPMAVSDILADLKLDVGCIAVGLLHDVIEDTLITHDEVKVLFGQDIADMVDGLSKIAKIRFKSKAEAQAENFRKMLFAMAKDIRVVLVKLADRTHNMRTLNHMKPEKQQSIARETLEIYAPIANRLGIQKLKIELEDLSFKYLHRDIYDRIAEKLASTRADRAAYTERCVELLHAAMDKHGLDCHVYGRPKHLYSIYKKMVRSNVEFEQIYDLTAFRLLVDTVGECYQALGYVHSMYRPVSERFKDYIALSKTNGYRSLHTTVIGPGGEHIEIQIRTRDMHNVAEKGIAAHWQYKEGQVVTKRDELETVTKLRQLYEWARDVKDPTEFMQSIREDLFADEIFVFTPAGEVKEFPEGATPLDFAFAVHTQVGLHCVGAKANGRIVPFAYPMHSGDTIEILTNPSGHPNSDWLNVVATSRARNKIRSYLRQEERDEARELGRGLLEREFKRHTINFNRTLKDGGFEKLLEKLRVRSVDEIISGVGLGKFKAERIAEEFIPKDKLQKKPPRPAVLERIKNTLRPKKPSGSPVLVRGEGGILVNFAKCCNPLHGDPIVGLTTVGQGITVHLEDCRNLLNLDPERRIEVAWDEGSRISRPVRVRVICVNRSGILASMSKTISQEGVNITSAECRVIEDQKAVNNFEVNVSDRRTLEQVIKALERIRGVISVERIAL